MKNKKKHPGGINIFWKNETRNISDLIPADYNPRKLTEKQAKDLSTSLDRFDLADPIVINTDNKIIGGHQRIKILSERGVSSVDVRVPDKKLTEKQEKELNLRLNKNLGEWDFDLLADFDMDMLLDVGFDSAELDSIFDVEPDEKDDDVPEAPEVAKTKPGDIYILGKHRLMCGDSTSVDSVEKLMDGKKADMVFTDPPYALFGNSTGVANICDDNMVRPFFREIMAMFKGNTKVFGHIYMCCDWHSAFSIESCAREVGLSAKNMCIWDKGDGGVGAMYQQCYEIVWFFDNSPISKKTIGKTKAGVITVNGVPNIWRFNRVTGDREHNAQKPVDMIAVPIVNGSKNNETILDLFLGSGSTLIACEKTNRICYGMELDPKYCDVIVKRWEDYTGSKSELV